MLLFLVLLVLARLATSSSALNDGHASARVLTAPASLEARDSSYIFCDNKSIFYCDAPQTCFTGLGGNIGCCSDSTCKARICIPYTSGHSTSCDYSTGGCASCLSDNPFCATVTNVVASQYIAYCAASQLLSTVSYVNAITTGSMDTNVLSSTSASPASTISSKATLTSTSSSTSATTSSSSGGSYTSTSASDFTSTSASSTSLSSPSSTSISSSSSTSISSSKGSSAGAISSTSTSSTSTISAPSTTAGQTSAHTSASSDPSQSISTPGLIAGIVVGSVCGTGLFLILLFLIRKRLRKQKQDKSEYRSAPTTTHSNDHDGPSAHDAFFAFNEKAPAIDGNVPESPDSLVRGVGLGISESRGSSYPGQQRYRILNPDVPSNDSISPVAGHAEAPTDRPVHRVSGLSSGASPATSKSWIPSPLVSDGGVSEVPTTPGRRVADDFTRGNMSGATQRNNYVPYSPSVYTASGQPPESLARGVEVPSMPQQYSVAELDGHGKGKNYPSVGRNSDRDTPWRYLSAEEAMGGGWKNEERE